MGELQGIARVKFHEGKVEEFKRLSAQAMEISRTKDGGTLQYDIYLNDDQSEGIVAVGPPPEESGPVIVVGYGEERLAASSSVGES